MAANLIHAARYLRMSTEHQQYSLENQSSAIQRHAESHGFRIVQTYADAAKTGVVLKRRNGLCQLLQDVVTGNAPYRASLSVQNIRADASFLPKIAFEGMDVATLRGLIAAGLGIALLPPAPARFAGVVEIKLSPARPIRALGIGWVDARYLPACAIEFRSDPEVSAIHGAADYDSRPHVLHSRLYV